MPEIETERLRLRMFTPADFDALALMYADPDVLKYLGDGKPVSRDETVYHLARIIELWEIRGFGRWALTYKHEEGLIGYSGLTLFDGRHEVVFGLARQHWGRGLATEAARACLRYGFEELDFQRISAVTRVANVASERVIRRLGMTFEKELLILDIDHVLYAISREDFHPDTSTYILSHPERADA